MLNAAGIILASCIIAKIEVSSLLKKTYRKELWIFAILLIFATGLAVAQSLDIDIPNPMDLITTIYKPMSDLIFGLLEQG